MDHDLSGLPRTSAPQWGHVPSTKRSARNLRVVSVCTMMVSNILAARFTVNLLGLLTNEVAVSVEVEIDLLANPGCCI